MATKKQKQILRMLDYMRTHDGITTEEAVMRLNIWSPARRIKDLRDKGYEIETVWIKPPEGRPYGVYKLIEE